MKLETLPGNSTNPESYPFDVALVHVKGANMDTVEVNPCQEMLDEYLPELLSILTENGKTLQATKLILRPALAPKHDLRSGQEARHITIHIAPLPVGSRQSR